VKKQQKRNVTLDGNSATLQVKQVPSEFVIPDHRMIDGDSAQWREPQLLRSVSMFTRKLQNTSQDVKRMVGMAVDFLAVVVALAIAFLLRLTVVDVSHLCSAVWKTITRYSKGLFCRLW
jgi:hypothetical protein